MINFVALTKCAGQSFLAHPRSRSFPCCCRKRSLHPFLHNNTPKNSCSLVVGVPGNRVAVLLRRHHIITISFITPRCSVKTNCKRGEMGVERRRTVVAVAEALCQTTAAPTRALLITSCSPTACCWVYLTLRRKNANLPKSYSIRLRVGGKLQKGHS